MCLTGSRTRAQSLWLLGLVVPRHVESSRIKNGSHVPCIGKQILTHCTTREVPPSTLDVHQTLPMLSHPGALALTAPQSTLPLDTWMVACLFRSLFMCVFLVSSSLATLFRISPVYTLPQEHTYSPSFPLLPSAFSPSSYYHFEFS